MNKKIILFTLLLPFSIILSAQSSNKSKSRDRFRAKEGEENKTELYNAVNLNTQDDEFAPAFYENGIVFVSNQKGKGQRDRQTGQAYFDLYFSPFDPNGIPTAPNGFPLEVTTSKNEGPVTFSRDRKILIYTQSNNKDGVPKAGKDGAVHLKLYLAMRNDREWKRLGELPFCSNDYDVMTPSLSADNKRLYFSSNMPGGYGGFDIYYSDLENESWSAPVNAGPVINTEGHESFPFIAQSGALFFSSTGHTEANLGGFDLYYANPTPDGFQDVVNLNAPFNTEFDEKGIIMDFDGKRGYFTSNRENGKGKDDIYSFKSPLGLQGIEKPKIIPAEIVVLDQRSNEPMQGVEIRVLQPTDDGFVSGSKDFYDINLNQMQDRKNALSFEIARKDAEDMGKPDYVTNAAGKALLDFTRYKSYLVLVSKEGYVTSERLVLAENPESGKLKFQLKEAPPCIRASGIVASDKFGTRIPNVRMKFVHSETGYEELLRTNSNGQYDGCLQTDGRYVVYVEREGFQSKNFEVNIVIGKQNFEDLRISTEDATATAEDILPLSNGLRDNSVLVMDKIFYEFNKATLNFSAVRHMEALLDLLKRYPEMEIDLVSHTETRGDAKLNQELTDERSKNAKIYLVSRGVDEKRITPIGKGESEPRNRCVDGIECTDEEHQQNNRIEIRIKKLGKPK